MTQPGSHGVVSGFHPSLSTPNNGENILSRSILTNTKEYVTKNLNPSDPNYSSIALEKVNTCIPPDRPPISTDVDHCQLHIPDIVLPTCAEWFDINSVNSVERAQLPTLFTNISPGDEELEQQYLTTRNCIVSTYRRNPREYLSVTDCRRFIDGDAALLLRLHSFLDYWGLINFQADPATAPSRNTKPRDFKLCDTSNAPRGTKLEEWRTKRNAALAGGGPWKCAACGKICVYTYYVIRPGSAVGISMGVLDKCVWCLRCYAAGRYPAILNEKQFLKVDLPIMGGEGEGTGEWSAQESERLIEGIELYKENWESVAQHVGSDKTARQCVAFFIQLPIQEPFLPFSDDEEDENNDEQKKKSKNIPFMDTGNPLLSQLAFLASVVNPQVATAAAKASLDAAVKLGISDKIIQENTPDTEINKNNDNIGVASEQKLFDDCKNQMPSGFISERDMQMICGTSIAAAVVRAKQLAISEEQEVKKLMPQLLDFQLRKLQLKIDQFKAIEIDIKNQKMVMERLFEAMTNEHASLSLQLQHIRDEPI